ncbi:glycine receptor subunit alpha-3-like [Tubulanus polymorphus]|uniref:glycine receptor subunit alpha-3-like n=1 Tax=Tubulanus polymorphus TaxID=672921 RepID=UPI003DA1F5C7
MDYRITTFLELSWRDPRLKFDDLINDPMITLDAAFVNKFWIPDIFFTNSKHGMFHDITVPNKLIRIYDDGWVIYIVRLTLTLSCPMNLYKFPLDTQMCRVRMESFAFTTSRMKMQWNYPYPLAFDRFLELSQYDLENYEVKECEETYINSTYPCLETRFFLRRKIGVYLMQVYLPMILIVVISWISFWIHIDAVPARVSLSVVTILAMITQSSGIHSTLPRVSYVKAIDVWMSACLAFVFAALMQYALISMYVRDEMKPVNIRKSIRKFSEMKPCGDENYIQNPMAADQGVKAPVESNKIEIDGKMAAMRVDKISRRVFPGCFLIFNIIYWTTYCSMEDDWKPGMT